MKTTRPRILLQNTQTACESTAGAPIVLTVGVCFLVSSIWDSIFD